MRITKSQLTEWFNTPSEILSWEGIANNLSSTLNTPVTEKQAMDFYRQAGYNLQARPRKADLFHMVEIIDDTNIDDTNIVDLTEAVVTNLEPVAAVFDSNGLYQ